MKQQTEEERAQAAAYVGTCRKCGAMVAAAVDEEEWVEDTGAAVGEWISSGLIVNRTTVALTRAFEMCKCVRTPKEIVAEPLPAPAGVVVFGTKEANLIAKQDRLLAELVEYFVECREAIHENGIVDPEVWNEYAGECPDYLTQGQYLSLMNLAVSTAVHAVDGVHL